MRKDRIESLFLLVFVLLPAFPAFAFKQGIHQEMTESVLRGLGFDADSADEVGDANWFTDVNEPTNSAAHFDDENLAGGSARLTAQIDAVIDKLLACDREGAHNELGKALHTVQDLYSHSNSVNNSIGISNPLNLANPSASLNCAPPVFAPGGLTSGYFSLIGYLDGITRIPPDPSRQCISTPGNKCCHFHLNKDEPTRAGHLLARQAAELATTDYLTRLEQRMSARVGATTTAQLMKLLKRKQRELALVIDDTGSMFDDIANVQSAVSSLLDSLVGGAEAPQLNLVTFKDGVTDRGRTCNLEQFRAQVNSLFASGGGDCPEASNSGLLRGISKVGFGGQVVLATDASAGDASLGPVVYASAAAQGIGINAILTGDCVSFGAAVAAKADQGGNEDQSQIGQTKTAERSNDAADMGPLSASVEADLTSPSARRQLAALTALTGGILFNVQRSEVNLASQVLFQAGRPDSNPLLNFLGELVSGSETILPVRIDATVNAAQFVINALTGSLLVVELRRPDGSLVNAGDPGVSYTALSTVRAYRVDSPQAGEWRLRLVGDGRVGAQMFALTSFSLTSNITLLDPNVAQERPEVESKELQGQPVAGQPALVQLRFSADPSSVLVRVVRPDGSVIQELPATRIRPRYFQASFVPPNEQFSLVTTGVGPGGENFQRSVRQQFRAQTLRVSAPGQLNAPLGIPLSFPVNVENLGASGSFALRVVSARGFGIVAPTSLAIEASKTASFTVTVNLPATAPGISDDLVTVAVSNIADLASSNSATVHVNILDNRAPDCSRATLSMTSDLWPPNHKMISGSIAGVSDPDGDAVSIEILGIQQSEPTLGLGAGTGRSCPDGRVLGLNLFDLRAEREGSGDGRQYRVAFKASDGKGGSCQAAVSVCLPHDRGKPLCKIAETPFDSTRCP